MKPELSIIIVNWNVKECLRRCLRSIYEKVNTIPFEIIVVDNASSDGSSDAVKIEFPMVRLIINRRNNGFGRANNQAVRQAKGRYLLLLNPDTEVLRADFKTLVRVLEEGSDIGAIVPLIYNHDGSLKYAVIRTIPKIRDVINFYIFHQRLKFRYSKAVSLTKAQVHEYPSGSCCLIKRSIFETIGGFDEHYFLFFEDTDFGDRLNKVNLKTISIPEFKIIHLAGKSTEQNIMFAYLSEHQSALYFFKKTKGTMSSIVIKVILIAGAFIEIAYLIIRSFVRFTMARSYKERIVNNLNIIKWHIWHSI